MGRNPRPRTIRETSNRRGDAFVPPSKGWTATTSGPLWRLTWLRRDRAKAGKPAPTRVRPSTTMKVVFTAGMLASFPAGCHDFVRGNTKVSYPLPHRANYAERARGNLVSVHLKQARNFSPPIILWSPPGTVEFRAVAALFGATWDSDFESLLQKVTVRPKCPSDVKTRPGSSDSAWPEAGGVPPRAKKTSASSRSCRRDPADGEVDRFEGPTFEDALRAAADAGRVKAGCLEKQIAFMARALA